MLFLCGSEGGFAFFLLLFDGVGDGVDFLFQVADFPLIPLQLVSSRFACALLLGGIHPPMSRIPFPLRSLKFLQEPVPFLL